MSKQYPGGLITKSPVTPSGPYERSSAPGVWTVNEAEFWRSQGKWPTQGNVYTSQTEFATAGTYSWVVPEAVVNVSVVCIGGGGGGALGLSGSYGGQPGQGGGGGELRYKNNIAVTPGQTITVVVGAGGLGKLASGFTITRNSTDGGQSSFNSTTCVANGGIRGGTYEGGGSGAGGSGGTGDGGGNGGSAASAGGGAGGAGGYSGNGGNGGSSNSAGSNGSGGGGGGGGGTNPNSVSSAFSYGGGRGGGVGTLGQGSNGAGGARQTNEGVSGGNPGNPGSWVSGNSGPFGAGANPGGQQPNSGYNSGGDGGGGAVRIIWPGDTRSFPSTNTGNV